MNLQDQFSAFFSNRVVELLAGAVGLNPAQAQMALRAILPRQLDHLADLADNPQTAVGLGDLWSMGDLPNDPETALSSPEGISRLENLGQTMSNRLFGNGGTGNWLGDAAQLIDGNQNAATRLSNLALPLLLSFLGRSGVTAQNAASQLTGMRGALGAMLPTAGLAAGTASVTPNLGKGEVIDSVVARPEVEVERGAPVAAAAPTPTPEPERHLEAVPPAPVVTEERSGCNPLWLLPLLLLAGLAWYLTQNRAEPVPAPTPTTTTEQTTETTTTETTTATSTADEGIVVANVQDGADLPIEPFVLSGTAPADEVITITNQDGEVLATETADASGNWEAQMPAPLEGTNTYTLTGTPSNATSEFAVNGVAGAAATEGAAETTEATTTTETAVVPVEITDPASGAAVAAESFNISGTGQPNASYSLFEDGVNVGTFFADETGAWTADITAAQEGERNYILVDENGNQVAELPVVVNAPVASADCSVNDVLTLSLADGDTVSAPFRFGGTGSAESYQVRVFRGADQIGETEVDNGDNCAWSYLSQPGGREDEVGEIRYEVTPAGADAPEADITLNVIQSGVNFENGEYVGPTGN